MLGKLVGLWAAYAITLGISYKIQEYDLLLGYTLGVVGVLVLTVLGTNEMAKEANLKERE
jgi:hypothetical protein